MRNTCLSITIVIFAVSSPFFAQDGYFAEVRLDSGLPPAPAVSANSNSKAPKGEGQ
jgi:hypothetical protein